VDDSSYLHMIDCARRAADRAAAILHRELGRRTTSLRAITCIAPLLGMFGTALLLMDELRFRVACVHGDCAGGPAEAFVPTLLSLPVAIIACGGFHFLSRQVEAFDLEMRVATLDLLNDLVRHRPGCG
jgi:biopolymer transport protein ExbB/TolQ